MTDRVVTVVPEAGLHARPAAEFVETANEYDCKIEAGLADNGERVDARSMLAVTSLGAGCGDNVALSAEGEDAEDALDALEAVLSTSEGDGG
ncbi:HPr family phosphocarrier protein [Halobacterium noricense]|uniref:HPr family phosphocarrier protein n=1 Tax=Halobacterium noricense TaxID=223182 RepID=UPI001E4B0C91|nr:HPr family phosphocarrier protein [Halobacterium noricense]UHH24277.1 HPr family phosphocarrier protein [Halobacterium noricense]